MRSRGTTQIITTLARKILMLMAAGKMCLTTVRFGRPMSLKVGRRIAMATGPGSLTAAGPGSVTSRGDGRRITMGAGCITAIRGRGGRDRCGAQGCTGHSGRLPMFRSSAGAEVLDLASASVGAGGVDLAGCRWGRVTGSIRGGVVTADALDLPAGAAAASDASAG